MGFLNRMEEAFTKGIVTAKEVINSAREKTVSLGEKGALRFEVVQLENQAQKRLGKLGAEVYEMLVKKGRNTVTKKTPEIKTLLQEIAEIDERIAKSKDKIKREQGE